jgi:phosphatidylinositol alpha-1,6-mannosyltransferase
MRCGLSLGMPDAVDDQGTGLVVEPTSVEAVAEALLHLLQDPARAAAMGTAGRQRVEPGFRRERLLPRVISLLKKVGRKCSP